MDRNVSLYDGSDISSTKLSVKSGCVQNPDAKGCHGDETLNPLTPKGLGTAYMLLIRCQIFLSVYLAIDAQEDVRQEFYRPAQIW